MEITIGHRTVVPKTGENNETVCKKCCFSKNGRSTRTCPRVSYLDNETDYRLSNDHLCAMVGDLTYFTEVIHEDS